MKNKSKSKKVSDFKDFSNLDRNEQEEKNFWNIEAFYKSDEAWEEEYQELQAELENKACPEGSLAETASSLLNGIEQELAEFRKVEKIYVYAHLRHDENTADSKYHSMYTRAKLLYVQINSRWSFFDPELLELADEKLIEFYAQEPKLLKYKHFIEQIQRSKAYTLSPKEEKLLAEASNILSASTQSFSMLNNADLKFSTVKDSKGIKHQVSIAGLSNILISKDRKLRKRGMKALLKEYKNLGYTFASLISSNVDSQNFIAHVRGFKSAREAAMFSNAIPEQVYDNLTKTVNDNLSLLHRYVKLRKKILGYKKLYTHDLYVPLSKIDISFTFEEAKNIVLKAVKPMGSEYQSIIEKAFAERWVDIYPNKGKRSGAYSSGCFDSIPYILMNWQNDLNSLYTLIHELGHSVHSYLSRKNQSYVYSNYVIFQAEIASTLNEVLLTNYLLNNGKDPKKRKYYITQYLDSFRATVFRQTMFAEFEQLIHEKASGGEILTKELLCQEYGALNAKYYGKSLENMEEISYEWARIPHFYYNFYVYQYATGFSAATAFSKRILEKQEGAVEAYLDFLRAGGKDYPLELLKKAGLDMTSSKAIEEAMSMFSTYTDLLEEINREEKE